MSTHSIIQRSLVVGFVLSLAGVAFARQPPVLTKAQRAAEHAIACEGAPAQPGAGYRAAFVRFGTLAQAAPTRVAHSAAGYRDSIKRFGIGPAASEFACTPTGTPRHSASL
jgi:hypothetical protein